MCDFFSTNNVYSSLIYNEAINRYKSQDFYLKKGRKTSKLKKKILKQIFRT